MKAKIPITCAAIMLFAATAAQATLDMDIYEDAVIQEGDSYNIVSIYDTPPGHTTVSMTGGLVDRVDGYNESHLNVAGGEVINVYLRESSTANIFGGIVLSEVFALDSATVSLSEGGNVFSISTRNKLATINMMGGVTTYLIIFDSGTANIYGGEIRNNIAARDSATVNLYGYEFSYNPSAGDFHGGQLSGFWLDGTAFQIDLYDAETYDSINMVPEPASLLFLLSGGLLIRQKQVR